MPSAVAARWLVVFTLIFGVTQAHADRRPVAVINLDLSDSPAPKTLAGELELELTAHPELRMLPDSSDAAALKDRVDDEDTPRLARAKTDLDLAEQELGAFNKSQAIRYAEEGQRELLVVTPSLAVKLYAALSFVHGKALVDDGRHVEAREAFALVRALDPSFVVDPGVVAPEYVSAYNATAVAPASVTPGSIDVKGTGVVWIDGAEVGVAPGVFPAPAGRHIVWLTGVDRETRGLAVVVAPGQVATAEIPDAEASRRTKVQRARTALARAPDPTARAAAMTRLATLIEVKDAVLLSLTNDTVVYQTWREASALTAPGFSAHEERGTRKPADLLLKLAPPKPAVADPPTFDIPVIPPEKRWYQKRNVQVAGIAAFVVSSLVGGYFLWNAMPDRWPGFDTNLIAPNSGSTARK